MLEAELEPHEATIPDGVILPCGFYWGDNGDTTKPKVFSPDKIQKPRMLGKFFFFSKINEKLEVPLRHYYGAEHDYNLPQTDDAKTFYLGKFRSIKNLEYGIDAKFRFYFALHVHRRLPGADANTFLLEENDQKLKLKIIDEYIIPQHHYAQENPNQAKVYHNQLLTLNVSESALDHLMQMSQTILDNKNDLTIEKAMLHAEAYIAMKKEDYFQMAPIQKAINELSSR